MQLMMSFSRLCWVFRAIHHTLRTHDVLLNSCMYKYRRSNQQTAPELPQQRDQPVVQEEEA